MKRTELAALLDADLQAAPLLAVTGIGSVPHETAAQAAAAVLATCDDLPYTATRPSHNPRETLLGHFWADIPHTLTTEGVVSVRADALHALEAHAPPHTAESGERRAWIKTQICGPVTAAAFTRVTDTNGRGLDAEGIAEACLTQAFNRARFELAPLHARARYPIVVLDEPRLAEREFGADPEAGAGAVAQVRTLIAELTDAEPKARIGIHVCDAPYWPALLDTGATLISVDVAAYERAFRQGGKALANFLADEAHWIAWGCVPAARPFSPGAPGGDYDLDAAAAAARVVELVEQVAPSRRAQRSLLCRSLITPSCGLGPATIERHDRVFATASETAAILRRACARLA